MNSLNISTSQQSLNYGNSCISESNATVNPEIRFFDNIAATWDENEVLSLPPKVRYILSRCGIKKGDRVLDLGTGTGVLIPYIIELTGETGHITAVDFSRNMLMRAKDKYGNPGHQIDFLQADFENEPIEGRFNVIMLYCVYPHLHKPTETLKRLIKENLAPDGSIYIAFPSDEHFINSIHAEKKADHDHLPSPAHLARRLSTFGISATVIGTRPDVYLLRLRH